MTWTRTVLMLGVATAIFGSTAQGRAVMIRDNHGKQFIHHNPNCTNQCVNPGPMTALATIQAISFRAPFIDDTNNSATATVRYKRTVDSTWSIAYPPIVDRRTMILVPNDNLANAQQARGSIVGLTAGTSYDVELTWADADGVVGGSSNNPVRATITTAAATPTTGGSTFYVATTGSDGANGATGTPWQTIQHALDTTAAGDTIKIRTGTYAAFTITTSGAAGAYREITPDTAATVTISGSTNTIDVQGDYWWVHGFTLGASTSSLVKITGAHHHLYLTNLTSADFATGDVFGTGGIATTASTHDLFILNNTFIRTTTANTSQGIDGISFQGAPHSTVVICGNTITGPMQDGIGNGTNSDIANFENVDFCDNTISGMMDDPIEMDGGAINLRLWGNTLVASAGVALSGALSEAGTMVGPSYVFRNYILAHNAAGYGIKGGHTAIGYAFFFHNTIVTDGTGSGHSGFTQAGGPTNSERHVYRNNIIVTNGNTYEHEGRSNTYDYDLSWIPNSADPIYQWDDTTNYSTWAAFLAGTGQEAHSVSGNPNLDGSFHISNTSLAYNAGVALNNFNSADSAWPATHGAPDIGAYEVP